MYEYLERYKSVELMNKFLYSSKTDEEKENYLNMMLIEHFYEVNKNVFGGYIKLIDTLNYEYPLNDYIELIT